MEWISESDSQGMSLDGSPATREQRNRLRQFGFERYDDPDLTSDYANRKLREFGVVDYSSRPETLEEAEPATPKQRKYLKFLGVDRYDDPDLTKAFASQCISSRVDKICRHYRTDDRNRALSLYEIDRARGMSI
jgi:hypothetical protein